MRFFTSTMPSPVGLLTLVCSDEGLAAILWEDDDPGRVRLSPRETASDSPILVQATRELAEYFAGARTRFTIPLELIGTDFQKAVWGALLTIPFGETRSYFQIASQIGKPSACRAVGAANGRNPLSIVAPCHRVIGANGALTGFAGGIEAKAWLLDLERGQRRIAK